MYFFLIFLMPGLFESVDMKPMDMEDQLYKYYINYINIYIHHHQVEFVPHMQDWFNI